MPELPEVETVRRGLLLCLPGQVIDQVVVLRSHSIAHPHPDEFAQLLIGHTFENVERRGKYLLIKLSRGAGLAVHLRMSGRLLIVPRRSKLTKFVRVRIILANQQELRFEDMRVFGRLWYIPPGSSFEKIIPSLNELGKEPLAGLTGRALRRLFEGKTQAVKTALLDQRLIAGIGNIYADESLFAAAIHPQTKAGKLSLAQANRLVAAIEKILNKAILLGGASIRDYKDSRGVNGRYQNGAFVYGREGEPCHVCTKTIKRLKLAGRSTHFCPNCQSVNK